MDPHLAMSWATPRPLSPQSYTFKNLGNANGLAGDGGPTSHGWSSHSDAARFILYGEPLVMEPYEWNMHLFFYGGVSHSDPTARGQARVRSDRHPSAERAENKSNIWIICIWVLFV